MRYLGNYKCKLILWLVSITAVFLLFVGLLGNWLVISKPLDKADAIFVLAGSANYVERNTEASRLYKLGVAPKILLSDDHLMGGWDNDLQRNPYYVERAKWLLMKQGVPEDRIEILPGRVSGTDDEANALSKYLQRHKLNSVLLVTSAYHSRRAYLTFRSTLGQVDTQLILGVRSYTAPAGMPPHFAWWLNREGVAVVFSEYIKLLYYLTTDKVS